jgi:hypothetical protein
MSRIKICSLITLITPARTHLARPLLLHMHFFFQLMAMARHRGDQRRVFSVVNIFTIVVVTAFLVEPSAAR